jgi:hypothetical protein
MPAIAVNRVGTVVPVVKTPINQAVKVSRKIVYVTAIVNAMRVVFANACVARVFGVAVLAMALMNATVTMATANVGHVVPAVASAASGKVRLAVAL